MGVSLGAVLRYDSVAVEVNASDQAGPSGTAEDRLLAAQARSGDVSAFEELVRRYRNDVFALSYHFVRNREEAWDISQEVFIKAYRSLKWFRGDASFKTWLMRITANHCKDHFKKRRLDTMPFEDAVKTEASAATPTPTERLEAAELGAAIEKAVDMLPAKHRTAFILREYEGLSYQDMAKVMRCNLGTVMSRLHHARKKLQNTLIGMGVVEES